MSLVQFETDDFLLLEVNEQLRDLALGFCGLATFSNGSQSYVVFKNETPIFESQRYEDVCFWIDQHKTLKAFEDG